MRTEYLIFLALALLGGYAMALPPGLGSSGGAGYRDPLIDFTSFDRVPTNTTLVGAGGIVWGGWADLTGNGFIVTNITTTGATNSMLIMQQANTQRTNFLYNSSLATSLDRSLVLEGRFRNANFTVAWPIVNPIIKTGVRVYTLNTNEFVVDVCSNTVILATSPQHTFTSVITNGQPIITDARATITSTNTIRVISTFWKLSDWQSTPQGPILGIATNTFSNSIVGNWTNGVAISLSRIAGLDNGVFNAWTYDNTATVTIPSIPLGALTNDLGYIGSSTYVVGSPTVPQKIAQYLTNTWAGSAVTTYNRAVGGTDTSDWLPNSTNLNNLKADMQAATGQRQTVFIMLGSNDAQVGTSTATWLSRMQSIINEIRTWGVVDNIVVEEIGVRLDGGPTYKDRIKAYNAARFQLYGCQYGNAQTLDSQSKHLNLLSGDNVHQTTAGGTLLATNQSLGIRIP